MKMTKGFWAVAGGGGGLPYVATDDPISSSRYTPTANAKNTCTSFQIQARRFSSGV